MATKISFKETATHVVLSVPKLKSPIESNSGKSFLITDGVRFEQTDIDFDGHPVYVSFACYFKPDEVRGEDKKDKNSATNKRTYSDYKKAK